MNLFEVTQRTAVDATPFYKHEIQPIIVTSNTNFIKIIENKEVSNVTGENIRVGIS